MGFTVASWNVLADAYVRPETYARCHREAVDPAARLAKQIQVLERLDADVICLQEVEEELSERLSLAAAWKKCYARKGGNRKDGCEIRLKPPLAPGPWDSFRYADGSGHVAVVTVVPLADGPVAVATSHIKWDPPGTAPEKRFALRQADELIAALQERGAGMPWIACGDFNVPPDDPVLARFTAAGFRDAYATRPRDATCVANGRARRIDFILYTGPLMPTPRPLPVLTDDSVLPSLEMPSDHLPIAATFKRLR